MNRLAAALCAVTLFTGGGTVTMEREEYLVGVVAAEMPAAYETEALSAQAVAARTWLYANRPCASHPEADVCDDSGCCQAYLSEASRRARWGAEFDFYEERVRDAVARTRGAVMTYGGEPILALYHAVSGGHTEDVERVYREALPYLRGVGSPGEEGATGYFTRTRIPYETLERLAGSRDIEILQRSESGRVLLARVGGRETDGRTLRALLSLRSTNFTVEYEDGGVVIEQVGYGHGVGMSQAGAQAMARRGEGWRDILAHYYTGVEFETLADCPP